MKRRATVNVNVLIVLIVALLFCLVIIKLSYVVLSETVDGINLAEKSASITTVEKTLYASRGSIFDINGEELASTVNSYKIIAMLSPSRTTDPDHPRHIVDKEGTAKALAPILNVSEEYLLNLFNKDVYQTELGTAGRDITEVTKEEIEKLELPGIEFVSNSRKRYYSQSTYASYIIGYAKKNDDGKLVGELGIEGYFDDILTGTDGYTKYLKYTSSNYQIPNTPSETKEAVDGSDIYLTIDRSIQMIAENAIKELDDNYDPNWAIFTVMDANTGAIVASATNPSFDPNNLNTLAESNYMNPLVSYTYEPGSVMKIFSFATAIDTGNYDENATYKSGSVTLSDGETTIRDAERQGWGTITYDAGFAHSSNVAATYLALKVGVENLTNYYNNLGFGSKVGIELSQEVAGKIAFRYESELATASFGQGITVTPIEMLQALSSITNDGTIIKPYIVDKIVDSSGNVTYEGKRTVVRKVFNSSTVDKMQSLMHMVIYGPPDEQWGKTWQADNVTLIGKTGTAQIASKSGGYQTGEYDYVKSFAGIFPEDDPKYIVYVVAEKLKTNTSVGWAKIVTNAISDIASYAKIAESENDVDPTKLIEISNYISKELNMVLTTLEDKKINVVVLGNGKYIINQYPNKNQTVLSGSKLFLLTNATEYTMTDLTGWSLNEVKTYCNLLGLSLDYTGYGYVTSQSIAPETILDLTNMTLSVELAK